MPAKGYWKKYVGYVAIHIWLETNYPKKGKCKRCGTTKSKRTEYANISGKYLRDIEDYVELCTSCHRIMDNGNKCPNGHEYTKENTLLRSNRINSRSCRECRRQRVRKFRKTATITKN